MENGRGSDASNGEVRVALPKLTMQELNALILRLVQNPAANHLTKPAAIPPQLKDSVRGATDLTTVRHNMGAGAYQSAEQLQTAVTQVFANAQILYPPGSEAHNAAVSLRQEFERMHKSSLVAKANGPATNSAVEPTGLTLNQKVDALLDKIEELTDSSGRMLADLFLDLPSREEYPDYFELIQKPIAFNDIRTKPYTSPREFIKDVVLLINNAQQYNQAGSQIFEDSRQIYKTFAALSQSFFPGESIPPSRGDAAPRGPPVKPKMPKSTTREIDIEKEGSSDEWISNDEEDSEDDEMDEDGKIKGEAPLRSSNRPKTPGSNKKVELYDSEGDDSESGEDSDGAPTSSKKAQKETVIVDSEEREKAIEKILGDRPKKSEDPKAPQEFEYFVKWKDTSYLHCEWVSTAVILEEKGGKNRLNRWNQKKAPPVPTASNPNPLFNTSTEVVEEYFPPEYCEVEKILATKQVLKNGKSITKYLVKWAGLGYAESTWEYPEDFKDDEKIKEFHQFNKPPPPEKPTAKTKWIKFDTCPPFKDGNLLRAYQLEGMNWLTFCWHEGRGSILADEMGLGKTVQSISFMNYLNKYQGIRGPFLVVAPLSTLGHWSREFEEWTDMNAIVYQGNKQNRDICRQYEFYYLDENGQPASQSFKFNALITTFEMLLSADWADLRKIKWKSIVVDEAQRLKNTNSKLLENLRTFKADHRILLTGTPLQNNTQELWTLLNFVEPVKFASVKDFMAEYGQLENSEQVDKLHAILRPHLLRRMKEDVEKSIPPKEETLVEVELTSIQKQYYKAFLEKNRDFLNKGCVGKNVPNLINLFMQLRKICNHPYLIPGVEEKENLKTNSQEIEEHYKVFIQASGKLVLLDKLLPKLKSSGHKVLIFSQMVRVLDLLETYLRYRSYAYERLDGGVRRNERQASIDRFCKPGSDRFVFLLCTRAGGLGINLTAADTVIIYDSDWNPQNDIQAQARCHRIGQTQEVKVYRLITANTYERKMFERSSKKLGLDQAVLHNMGSPAATTSSLDKDKPEMKKMNTLDKKEIDDLLKFGAYNLFAEDSKEKENQFYEEDIDQILNRSSKVVWSDENAKMTQGSTFSKATFRSNTSEPEIDINDPHFWTKILPEAKTADAMLSRLQKGEALTTKEKRQAFITDLGDLVNEVVIGFREGKPDEVSKTRSVLHEVFAICKGNLDGFTEEQRDTILRWAAEINKPRRERRGINRFGGGGSSTTYDPEEAARLAKKRENRIGANWPLKERKKFHSAFMALGPNRWEELQQRLEVERPMEEIREYGREFVKQCVIHSEDYERELFIDCLNAVMPTDDEQEIEVELSPDFTPLIKRKLKTWSRQLRVLASLKEQITENGVEGFEVPKLFKPLTNWWTGEDDKSLLVGIHKYGFDAYPKIRADPELTFVKHEKEMLAAEEKLRAEGVKVEEEVEEDEEEEGDNATPAKMEVETPSKEKDSKEESSKTPAKISTKITLRLPSNWPSSRALDSHVKYLGDTIRKQTYQAEKEEARERRKIDKIAKKKKAKEERQKEWSKREQIDFRSNVMQYGAGQWNMIRVRADLHKTVDQLEEYFVILMELCKQTIERFKDSKEEKDKDNSAEEEGDEKEEKDGKEKTPAKMQDVPKGGILGTLEYKLAPISHTMAKKLMKRVKLMNDIKNNVLKSSDLDERLEKARMHDVLPSWWTAECDRLLLESVARYGIGSNQDWEEFIDDDECPFYKNIKADQRKTRNKFLKVFVQEKPPLLKRLEYLCILVMDKDYADMEKTPSYTFTRSYQRLTDSGRKRKRDDGDEGEPTPKTPKAVIRDVHRDAEGKPILPISVKGSQIVSLGNIVHDRPAFHSRNYIWPVGYKSVRKLQSVVNPDTHTTYASEILDGKSGPIFRVSAADSKNVAVQHHTSSGAWCEMLKLIKKKSTVSVSGPEMYGFSDPTVKMLIQELPNSRLCKNYQWKDFDGSEAAAASASASLQSPNVSTPSSPSQASNFDSLVTPLRSSRAPKAESMEVEVEGSGTEANVTSTGDSENVTLPKTPKSGGKKLKKRTSTGPSKKRKTLKKEEE
eukprot:TRINITY_DN4061_c0_g1_i1.p1 TRINITY_DN4061_c0_g1~~TRINITY_DN4061_c0_g1_i1.p1  ORF type:complete len:2056 (-),score=800.22 TRINITY_DN4061_c0_g1_i1:68-6235(-)